MAQTPPLGAEDTTPVVDPGQEQQTLKFLFTPREALAGERTQTNPHAKATTYLPDVVAALRGRFGEAVRDVVEYAGEQTVYLTREALVEACRFLKEEQGFDYFTDLGAIDRFTEEDRFEVFYGLVSIAGRKRLRLKVRVDEEDPVVPSITGVYQAAAWHEREAWDMMGVRFDGNEDLRRLFMPEDFEYHPQRKEFPVLGIPGSLPLPPQSSQSSALTADPFARAHGHVPKD